MNERNQQGFVDRDGVTHKIPIEVCDRGDLSTALLRDAPASTPVTLGQEIKVYRGFTDGPQREIVLRVCEYRDIPSKPPLPKHDNPKSVEMVRQYREARAKRLCMYCSSGTPLLASNSHGGRAHWHPDNHYTVCNAIHILDAPLPTFPSECDEILAALLWKLGWR